MSITLNFELNDRDLAHFQEAGERSRKAAEGKSEQEIVDCAVALLDDAQKVHIPDFIKERLLRLDNMIAMVRDQAWALPDEDRQRVLSALMYFCDPQDVIPDHVEVLGFLDDAVMIELSVRELKHELDAYDDFCDYRSQEAGRRGADPSLLGRTDWLDSRRDELIERMHQRRARDFGTGYGRSSGYGSTGGYGAPGGSKTYSSGWRPGVFKAR
ncbi:MAG TPA: YkvA family protein [Thermomonas sp.]|nr:YkvA family protein [Thermomonas sp.]